MSHLAKLNLKTVHRNVQKDPSTVRREKLLAAIEEQRRVLSAKQQGKEHTVSTKRWRNDAAGQKLLVEHQKNVRPWFFTQDGGWYVQCKYGTRALVLSDKANAVFVKDLASVQGVLEAFYAACAAGEFDTAVAALAVRKSN
jgi:hypothetical protein